MNNDMIELAKLFGLNHERMPREVLAEDVCTLALEKIRASAVQIRAGQIQNDCMSSALQARNQQCDKLAAVLVEVNEFCQQRGIGKVGDSASAALMQRHDELAAQVERLRGVIVDAINNGAQLDNGCWVYSIDDSVLSEQPPAALAALKAKLQADILASTSIQIAAGKPEATPIQIATSMLEESKRIRQRAKEACDG